MAQTHGPEWEWHLTVRGTFISFYLYGAAFMRVYTEWVEFTFGLKGPPSLLSHADYPGAPTEILAHCLEFFRAAPPVMANVPRQLAVNAFEIIPSNGGYLGILALPGLPIHLRLELVAAHFDLFRDVFAADIAFGPASFMWWEWLMAADYHYGPQVHDDLEVCLSLLQTIGRILTLPSAICQRSALHGVNEIAPYINVDPRALVAEFLRSGMPADDEIRQYASQVANGGAQ